MAAFVQRRHAWLCGIDIAVDAVMTDPWEAARRLRGWIDQHAVLAWSGKDDVRVHKGTRYSGARHRARVTVTYSDERARRKFGLVDGAVVHVELRARGRRSVEAQGVRGPADLLDLDHAGIVGRHVRFEQVRVDVLGKQARGRSRPAMEPADWRVGGLFVRACQDSENGTSSQGVRDALRGARWVRFKSAMHRVPAPREGEDWGAERTASRTP